MKILIALLVIVMVVSAIASAAKKKAGSGKVADQYSGKPLLSENEKQWFALIKAALPNAHLLGQVALNQLVKAEGKNWRAAKNKIDPRSIDFIILNGEFAAMLAIEIDDNSHKRKDRQADDEKKANALRQAGIPLLRIPAMPLLSGDEVKARVVDAIAAHARLKKAA
jgi:hypothetical protein